MRVWLLAGLMVMATLATLPACAQTDEDAEHARHAELVRAYVNSGEFSADFFVEVAELRILTEFDDSDSDLPADVKAWLTTTHQAAAREVSRAIKPDVERLIFDTFIDRFSVSEREVLLAFQQFFDAPERAAILAEAQAQPTADSEEFLRQRLSPDDFSYLMRASQTPPVLTAFAMAAGIIQRTTDNYAERFNIEIRLHCDSAPKGIEICERTYRPVPILRPN